MRRTWWLGAVAVLLAVLCSSGTAPAAAPSPDGRVPTSGPGALGTVETWRVVVYADQSQLSEKEWENAFRQLQKFLSERHFTVTILPDGQVDQPLTRIADQLGLLGNPDAATAGTDNRARRLYRWQFLIDSPPFATITVPVPHGEPYVITADRAKFEPTKTVSMGDQSVSYVWRVTVPEAPDVEPEVTAGVKLAASETTQVLQRQVTITQQPSAQLQKLVRVKLFQINVEREEDRTRFLDIFRQVGSTSVSHSPTGDSGQPPILFIPFSKIRAQTDRALLTWLLLVEPTGPMYAVPAIQASGKGGEPTFRPAPGVQWVKCVSLSQTQYEDASAQKAKAGTQFFWQATLRMSASESPPVLFYGKLTNGSPTVWVCDPAGGATVLDPADWQGWTTAQAPPDFERPSR